MKNVVEEHVASTYAELLPTVPEAHPGCPICREDVMVYALNRLPARYVASVEGKVVTELNLDKDQTRVTIEIHVMEGFRKVTRSPRCGRAAPPPK